MQSEHSAIQPVTYSADWRMENSAKNYYLCPTHQVSHTQNMYIIGVKIARCICYSSE